MQASALSSCPGSESAIFWACLGVPCSRRQPHDPSFHSTLVDKISRCLHYPVCHDKILLVGCLMLRFASVADISWDGWTPVSSPHPNPQHLEANATQHSLNHCSQLVYPASFHFAAIGWLSLGNR